VIFYNNIYKVLFVLVFMNDVARREAERASPRQRLGELVCAYEGGKKGPVGLLDDIRNRIVILYRRGDRSDKVRGLAEKYGVDLGAI